MPDWMSITVWWLLFGGTHIALTTRPLRPPLLAALGDGGFKIAYSIVSFLTFVPLVGAYIAAYHGSGRGWQLDSGSPVALAALLLAGLAFTVVIASLTQASPLSFVPGAKKRAYGLTRITRHPMDMGLALWAASHLLVDCSPAALAFFGGFVLFCFVGCAHQDARKREDPELAEFFSETSLIPFAAITAGRTRLISSELPWTALAAGAAVAAGIFAAHPWMFS